MKKLSLLMALVLALTSVLGSIAFAEAAEPDYSDRMMEIIIIPGTDTQAELGATAKEIIEVDGLKFKDLNGNGALDVYEDWRADIRQSSVSSAAEAGFGSHGLYSLPSRISAIRSQAWPSP